MKNVAHPNMFPTAGEAVAIETPVDRKPVSNVAAAVEASPLASPWANPVERLHSAAGSKPAAEDPAPKEKRVSRSEQAVAYLRANGPATGAQLLAALGIESKGGITPFIGPGLQRGEIVREGNRYALPCQLVGRPPVDAPNAMPEEKREQPTAPAPIRVPTLKDGEVIRMAATSDLKPDFTLSADETLIVAWLDGSVTVQRGGVFIELTPNVARLLRAVIGLSQ